MTGKSGPARELKRRSDFPVLIIVKILWIVLVFATGIGLGWAIRGTSPAPETAAAASVPAPPRTRAHVRAPAGPGEKWRTLAERSKDFSSSERQKFLEELSAADRMAALQALAANPGYSGLPYQVKSLMEKILEAWAEEDFDGGWDAALGCHDPELRKYMIKSLLGSLAKTDPDRALDLHLAQLAADPEFSSGVPSRVLEGKLAAGAEAFSEFMGKLPFGSGSGGSPRKFPPDFDFRLAAENVAKLMKERGNKRPPVFPTNFLEQWALSDPEAAHEWASRNPELPFNSWRALLDVMDRHGETGEAAAWAAAKLMEPGAARERMIENISYGDESTLATRVRGIAAALPDTAEADRFLAEIVAGSSYSEPLKRHAFAFAAMSSPEARLAALRNMNEKHRLPDDEKFTDSLLAAWEITRAQVAQIRAAER